MTAERVADAELQQQLNELKQQLNELKEQTQLLTEFAAKTTNLIYLLFTELDQKVEK